MKIFDFRTESNCPVARNHNNNSSTDADGAGVVLEETDDNLGEGTSGTSGTNGNGSRPGVRELSETPKPTAKLTKKNPKINQNFKTEFSNWLIRRKMNLGLC